MRCIADERELRAGEGDEGGDTGREDDEQQTDDDLVGGFGIVALPVADQRPAAPHIHDAQTDEADYGGNRRDDLGDIPDIIEQLGNKILQVQARSSSQ